MTIIRDERQYNVTETTTKWVIKVLEGKVSLKYEISKQDCPTFEDLQNFVSENKLFEE